MFFQALSFLSFPFVYTYSTTRNACAALLFSLNVYGSCSQEDREKYLQAKSSNTKTIIIFNHPTCYDHLVIMKELGDPLRFVMSYKYLFWPFRSLAQGLRCIIVYPKSQTSALIAKEVSERKQKDPMIAISPHGGDSIFTPWELPPFRTGAFLARPTVIPVVIRYFPHEPWLQGMSLFQILCRRIFAFHHSQYVMKVLDAIEMKENEDYAIFAERCRTNMSTALSQIELKQKDRILKPFTYYTSYLFLLSASVTVFKGMLCYSAGMFVVFCTSVLYHGSLCDIMYKYLDVRTNILMAVGFSMNLLWNQQIAPICWLTVASIGYLLGWNHAVFVHGPITIGFLSIKKFISSA